MKSILEIARPTRFLPSRALDSFCRARLFEKLGNLDRGYLEILEAGEKRHAFGDPLTPAPYRARVEIRNPRAYSRIALGGSVGTGESFVDGDWDADDLVALTRIFVFNRALLDSIDRGFGGALQPVRRLLHGLRANDVNGARKNIHAHYDLGNDFFSLFLDETWMYSAGYYSAPESTLVEAQREKNDRICRKLGLGPNHRLLEIGTGWGGFAIHAAKEYGCHVTTTTISAAQFEHAKARIRAENLEDRVTLLSTDYRSLRGKYDRLVSIEMIEAVGLRFLDSYFAKCADLLTEDGAMCLQSILIQDQFFEQAARSVDFIQTHVFPGSAIPSVARIMESVRGHTDLKLAHLEDFGEHYARTIREWTANLDANRAEIPARGYPDHLYRLWRYYFAYCEGGFWERQIGVGQFTFTKPRYRGSIQVGESPSGKRGNQ